MKRSRRLLATVLLVILITCLLSVCAFADDGGEYQSRMYATFWALVPPIIAIVLALITKEVYSSLFIGIVAGALFYSNFNPVMTLNTLVQDGLISGLTDAWNAGIFLFLVLLGIIVALINKAGGSAAFGRWAQTHIHTRVGAMFATFVLGILIFIDDYFNCLTVGSVMRPVTDGHRISRAKLAYLIDATAAPVCMIAPISSWAAAVSGMVDGQDGIALFCRAIPYNYYSLLTFVFILGIIFLKFDYGPMKLHEKNARENGDLFTCGQQIDTENELDYSPRGRVCDLIIPIVILIALCVIGIIYVGGFFDGESFILAFGNTDASLGLPWGSIVALVVIILYLICRRVITFKEAMACIPKGFVAMVPALLILTFAITLKNITGLLGASTFVATQMENAAPGLTMLLPAIIFVVGCLLAFATGTSWGTFGILIPIVTDAFPPDSPLFIIGISACLAGAVCGDHCSPISDTTIMSSAGAQCDHVNHVSTQLPYALTVAGVSFVTYLVAGRVQNAYIPLIFGIVLTIVVLLILRAVTGGKKQAQSEK